jgi:hypothetical protein
MISPLAISTDGYLTIDGGAIEPIAVSTVGYITLAVAISGGGGFISRPRRQKYEKIEEAFKDILLEDGDLAVIAFWTMKYIWKIV